MELNEADIRRFGPEMNMLGLPQARIPDVLGRHYDISYPGLTMDMARGQRRTPFMRRCGTLVLILSVWRVGNALFISAQRPRICR